MLQLEFTVSGGTRGRSCLSPPVGEPVNGQIPSFCPISVKACMKLLG
jgi:hypothetical protein